MLLLNSKSQIRIIGSNTLSISSSLLLSIFFYFKSYSESLLILSDSSGTIEMKCSKKSKRSVIFVDSIGMNSKISNNLYFLFF